MSGRKSEASGYRERNSTADRALVVLQLFSEEKPVWSGAEISEHIGVARSTGYRYLSSLVQSGFIAETNGGFQLGPRIFQLARVARGRVGLAETALPAMQELADSVQETVLLTRRSGSAVVCLERVEAPRAIRLSYERGYVLPINAGAAAEALLAWLPQAEIRRVLSEAPLQRFTASTLVDAQAIEERLEQIRRDGYALTRGEVDPDVLGIAAPIRGHDGSVSAAVSIAALSTRVNAKQAKVMTEGVLAAAATITERVIELDL
ncbi:IclR family transcriptional regulator [Nocardioides sp. LHG3406-4]|uniref:IclR family transcriptional regulator n=1 Tax=Nocardioides sp. LHG3406-4 TaxID=2804575 RepID=UPI003CF94AF4